MFFETNFDDHVHSIYENKQWPEKSLFYVCCPSKTDPDVASEGHDNLFLLMPLATGLSDNENIREFYLQERLGRLEKHTGVTGLASNWITKEVIVQMIL